MHKFMEKTCEALEDIEKANSWNIMNERDRKTIAELVDLKKNLLKVEMLEGEDYSEAGDMMRDGYSGRRHHVRGHYSRTGADDNYSGTRLRDNMGRYSRYGYSMDSAKAEMMEHVDDMISSAPDEHTKKMAREFKEKLERM